MYGILQGEIVKVHPSIDKNELLAPNILIIKILNNVYWLL